MDKMNPGEWSDEDIRKLDFAWCVFIEPFFRFEEDCRKARQEGRVVTFQLVDHGSKQGRLTGG